jgi:hypothetical protein
MDPIRLFNGREVRQSGARGYWSDGPSSRWGERNTSPSPSPETTGPHGTSLSSTRTKIQRKETVKPLPPSDVQGHASKLGRILLLSFLNVNN